MTDNINTTQIFLTPFFFYLLLRLFLSREAVFKRPSQRERVKELISTLDSS